MAIYGINEITAGMKPHEKEIYFKHMEKRHREEREKLEDEKARLREWKMTMIDDLVRRGHSRERLMKMTTRSLERIY